MFITDGHETQAERALLRTRHRRSVRWLLELIGWPVAARGAQARIPPASHQHAVRTAASELPVCDTCGARHTDHEHPHER
jgi:hypothetical protein